MSDELRQLAHDYWQAYLDHEPTERHMLGDYSDVASFEHVSRDSEDRMIATLRDFADRADRLGEDGLDGQESLTRGVLASSARSRADYLEARLTELAADPIHGPQVTLGLVMGLLAVPDQAVADAMPAKVEAVGRFYGELAERVREGVARGWAGPEFAVRETISPDRRGARDGGCRRPDRDLGAGSRGGGRRRAPDCAPGRGGGLGPAGSGDLP